MTTWIRMLRAAGAVPLLVLHVIHGSFLGWWGSTGSSTAPHVHADNRQYKTRLTAWSTGHVTCGSPATWANTVGQVKRQ